MWPPPDPVEGENDPGTRGYRGSGLNEITKILQEL